MIEYIPPGDQLSGQPPGTADKYVQFLRDNVLPTLDFNYRTLNQPGQAAQPAAKCGIMTDIVIEGGRAVLGAEILETPLRVADGKICALGSERGRGALSLDASGLMVLPGILPGVLGGILVQDIAPQTTRRAAAFYLSRHR